MSYIGWHWTYQAETKKLVVHFNIQPTPKPQNPTTIKLIHCLPMFLRIKAYTKAFWLSRL